MIERINEFDFIRRFETMGRENQFSKAGLLALFNWLEDIVAEDYELDVVALCCDFAEYESFEDWQEDYYSKDTPQDERIQDVDELEEHTTVVYVDGNEDGGLIVGAF